MIYIFDSKIPENKSVFFALTNIYGINKYNSFLICKKLGFSKNFKIKNLSQEQTNSLLKMLELLEFVVGSNLKKIRQIQLKNLTLIKSYKGLRRISGLPVRGQRTHTNAKTAKKRFL